MFVVHTHYSWQGCEDNTSTHTGGISFASANSFSPSTRVRNSMERSSALTITVVILPARVIKIKPTGYCGCDNEALICADHRGRDTACVRSQGSSPSPHQPSWLKNGALICADHHIRDPACNQGSIKGHAQHWSIFAELLTCTNYVTNYMYLIDCTSSLPGRGESPQAFEWYSSILLLIRSCLCNQMTRAGDVQQRVDVQTAD